MPIRTNRGRAAVYRRVWGAPLRSPRHLVVFVVILVAVITAFGFVLPKLLPGGDQPDTAANGTRSVISPTNEMVEPGLTLSPSGPPETRLTEEPFTPTSAAPDPKALDVVKKWAQAWTHHPKGISNSDWLKGLAPFTTEEYLGVMKTIDPANIDGDKVTGQPVPIRSFTSSLEAEIATNGPKLRITVVSTDAGWRVAAYDKAS